MSRPRDAAQGRAGSRTSARTSSAATTERESREFFYVHGDGRVVKVTGYACETNMGSYWWCPEVGVSAAEGHSLFRDRVDAYAKAYAVARDAVEVAHANLARIEAERWL